VAGTAGDAGVAPTGAGFLRSVPEPSDHPLKANDTLDGGDVLPGLSVLIAEIFA
jgi:hypothetical protein